MLNSWNAKRVDEPDYAQRLDGFKRARESFSSLIGQKSFISHGLIVVHNCCFFIAHVSTLAYNKLCYSSVVACVFSH